MKQYKIFQHPSGKREAVKQGWSWPAFFFGVIWALVKKQWVLGISVLVGLSLLGFAVAASDGGENGQVFVNLVSLIVSIVFGVYGNSWREKNLISRGYEQTGMASATNPDGALAVYLKGSTGEENTSVPARSANKM
ncbi:MAG: DUF2628 domain-containing protein [Pseudomonadota bacterium]|nr:DUF2628 domain-containing protein [Pseudomonadota bacterium]